MPHCVAYNCFNTTQRGKNKAKAGISFHRFPTSDKKLFEEWVRKVQRRDWHPYFGKDTRLCSEHFTEDQFLPDKYYKFSLRTPGKGPLLRQKENAVPTLFY